MPRVAVITDSTASLPTALYGRYGIGMVPYYIHFADGVTQRDVAEIESEPFTRYLAALPDGASLPTTANPGPGDYERAYLRAAAGTDQILSLHITALGSGAYGSARIGREMALQQRPDLRIEIIDTRNVSMCLGWMALQAARAAADGATLDDLMRLVARMIPVTRMIQTADTLRYLYMGGRIGRAKHLLGALLRIKPLITMIDGEIATLGVARTRGSVYRRMAELVAQDVEPGASIRLALTYAGAEEDARELSGMVEEVVSVSETLFCPLCPALAVHSGPGTVGLCYTPTDASTWHAPREDPRLGRR